MNLIDLDDTIRSHMTAEIHHDTNPESTDWACGWW